MKTNKKIIIIGVIIIAVIIISLLVIFFLYFNNKNKEKNVEKPKEVQVIEKEVSEEDTDMKNVNEITSEKWNYFLNMTIKYLKPNFNTDDMVNFAIAYYANSSYLSENEQIPVDKVNEIITLMFGEKNIDYSKVKSDYNFDSTNNTFEYKSNEINNDKKLFVKDITEDGEESYTMIVDMVNIPYNADNNLEEYTKDMVDSSYKLVIKNNLIVSYTPV